MNSLKKKSLDSESDEEVEETLESLKNHLKECKRLGKYVEAQMAFNRIAELKENKANTKISKLQTSKDKELGYIERIYEREVAAVRNNRESKLDEYEVQADEEEKKLMERQEEELLKRRKELEKKFPEKVHPSTEYIALKKKEEALANQNE